MGGAKFDDIDRSLSIARYCQLVGTCLSVEFLGGKKWNIKHVPYLFMFVEGKLLSIAASSES